VPRQARPSRDPARSHTPDAPRAEDSAGASSDVPAVLRRHERSSTDASLLLTTVCPARCSKGATESTAARPTTRTTYAQSSAAPRRCQTASAGSRPHRTGSLVIGLRDGLCGFWRFPRLDGGSLVGSKSQSAFGLATPRHDQTAAAKC